MDSTGPVSQPAAPIPGGRSAVPIVILIGVAIGVAAVGAIVWQLLTRPGSAEDVAREFLVASYEGDIGRACELMAPVAIDPILESYGAVDCADLVEATREDPSVTEPRQAADIELLEATEDGDTASLRMSSPVGTPGVWTRVDLERIDGQWLVTDTD